MTSSCCIFHGGVLKSGDAGMGILGQEWGFAKLGLLMKTPFFFNFMFCKECVFVMIEKLEGYTATFNSL